MCIILTNNKMNAVTTVHICFFICFLFFACCVCMFLFIFAQYVTLPPPFFGGGGRGEEGYGMGWGVTG